MRSKDMLLRVAVTLLLLAVAALPLTITGCAPSPATSAGSQTSAPIQATAAAQAANAALATTTAQTTTAAQAATTTQAMTTTQAATTQATTTQATTTAQTTTAQTTAAAQTTTTTLETTATQTTTAAAPPIDRDREGNPITLPESIERLIVMGPSNTETIIALGCADKIIATDEYSEGLTGLPPDLPLFSMRTPDGEQIIALEPDVLIVTGMSKAGGDDPFKTVSDAGVCVIYIPSSSSIEGIIDDIRYVAEVMGVQAAGEQIIEDMENEIETIRAAGLTVTDKKTVYFEISAAPYMYSFGSGVFLNEMIELIGAINILGDQVSWISVSDEAVLAANPDVILTSVNYIDDPIGELMSRDGWEEITAVRNGDIYYISTNYSNRPNHNIVKALAEMANAIYPDLF